VQGGKLARRGPIGKGTEHTLDLCVSASGDGQKERETGTKKAGRRLRNRAPMTNRWPSGWRTEKRTYRRLRKS
jgi:hypothetical protein